jgi:hypothetical protein
MKTLCDARNGFSHVENERGVRQLTDREFADFS